MLDNTRLPIQKRLLCIALGVAVLLQGLVGFSGSGVSQAQAQTTERVRVAPYSKTIPVKVTRYRTETYTIPAVTGTRTVTYVITPAKTTTSEVTYTIFPATTGTRQVQKQSGTKQQRIAPYSKIVKKSVRVGTGTRTYCSRYTTREGPPPARKPYRSCVKYKTVNTYKWVSVSQSVPVYNYKTVPNYVTVTETYTIPAVKGTRTETRTTPAVTGTRTERYVITPARTGTRTVAYTVTVSRTVEVFNYRTVTVNREPEPVIPTRDPDNPCAGSWATAQCKELLNAGVDKSAIPPLGGNSNKNHMDTLLRALAGNPRFSFNIEKARAALREANLDDKDLIPRGLTADVICAGMGIGSRSCTPRALERRGITVGRSPITDSCSKDDQLDNGRCFDSTSGMTNDQLVTFASRLIDEFGSGGNGGSENNEGGNGGDGGTTTTTTTTTTTPVETTQTQKQCSAGQTGTPPNCVDDTTPADTTPETCPEGQAGTPPNCVDPAPAETAPWQVENLSMDCSIVYKDGRASLLLDIDWEPPAGDRRVQKYIAQIYTYSTRGNPPEEDESVADAQRFVFLRPADRKVAWNNNVYYYRRSVTFPHPQQSRRWPNTYGHSLAYGKKYTMRIRPVAEDSEQGDWTDATDTCPQKPPVVFLYASKSKVNEDVNEDNEDANPSGITVRLSKTWSSAVSVTVATGNDEDTATEDSDYTLDYPEGENRVVTIPAGKRSASVPLTIINDESDEEDETFTVTISEPSNATLGTASVTVTIIDNDEPEEDLEEQIGEGPPSFLS